MAGEWGPEWLAWTWVAVVGAAILAAVAVRLSGLPRLPALLLAWPFLRGTARPMAAGPARGADSELQEMVALDHPELQPDRSAG